MRIKRTEMLERLGDAIVNGTPVPEEIADVLEKSTRLRPLVTVDSNLLVAVDVKAEAVRGLRRGDRVAVLGQTVWVHDIEPIGAAACRLKAWTINPYS